MKDDASWVTVGEAYSVFTKYYNSNLLLYSNGIQRSVSIKCFTLGLLMRVLEDPNALLTTGKDDKPINRRLVENIITDDKGIDLILGWDKDILDY